MRIAYVTSRFPEVTETWIVRELDAVDSDPRLDCEVYSLFPPQTETVHPAAEPWLPRHRRPRAAAGLAALGGWLLRSPLRLLGAVALLVGGYARRPSTLIRALATVPIAAAHARSVAADEVAHVHAHFATYPLVAAWLCHRLTGVPYSFTAHAHDIFVDQSFLRTRLAEASFVVAVSEFNRGFLFAYGGDRTTPVHVIGCGIEPTAYEFRPRAPQPTDQVRALCVARFKEEKGHRFLLEALAEGGPSLERVSLDLVGDGPTRGEIEDLASRLGLERRIRFHGALPEPSVTELLEGADAFVLPSIIKDDGTMEGLPVVLMEALAAGVPVVATRISAVPELILDGETGLLAEPGDPKALHGALERLLADPDATLRRAEAGRFLVVRDHDARRSGASLASLFLARSEPGGGPGPS